MIAATDLSVTLSADLFRAMKAEARRIGVSIEWLVASLVADTLEVAAGPSQALASA